MASRPAGGSGLRVGVWVLHMALPVAGLWLLIARPNLDVRWEHHAGHFWLVALVAAVNVALGAQMSEAARRRGDARIYLVSLAFLSSAGFLLLHALATPQVLLGGRNGGFVVATPVGLLVAAAFALASSVDMRPERAAALMRRQAVLRVAVVGLLAAWSVVSLTGLPPLDVPIDASEAYGPLAATAGVGVALYGGAALKYFAIHRRRPAVLLVSLITAFVLLAEAMVAVAVARNWRASWWIWHLLMAAAFGFVAYSAHVQFRREGSGAGIFNAVSLEHTLRQIREEYASALEALVDAMARRAVEESDEPLGPLAAGVAARFELTDGQRDVLERAAEALAAERDQIRRLGGLVAVSRESRVIVEEARLLERSVELTGEAFGRDGLRIGLIREGRLEYPDELRWGRLPPVPDPAPARDAIARLDTVEHDGTVVLPLVVKGHAAGVLEVHRERGGFAERDRWILESLGGQLGIALENARLYRQIDALFRQYMSPDVATALVADPSQAALGGSVREVTALFADLRGFTPFTERTSPQGVVELLNTYFGAAVPAVLAQGGTVMQFVGDAVSALFNAPTRQPAHALLAARAGLELQRATGEIAAAEPGLPRFRVGINTGTALVGNIGSTEMRYYTAIGDSVNLASRLEGIAEPGQVVIGAATYEAIRDLAVVRPLGTLRVKGRAAAVEAYVLEDVRG